MRSVRKYIGVSTLAALGVVYHAFSTREQCALVSDLMQSSIPLVSSLKKVREVSVIHKIFRML